MRRPVWFGLVLLWACASRPPLAAPPALPAADGGGLRGLDYLVTPAADLHALAVKLCFQGQPPAALVYGQPRCQTLLRAPRALGADGRTTPLTLAAGRIQLGALAADSCVAYEVDLRAALDEDSLLLAYPGQGSIVLGIETFLWRPPQRPAGMQTQLRFALPAGMQVSTPWRASAENGVYPLDEGAFAFTGHIVLGHFSERTLTVPGTQLRAAILDGFPPDREPLIVPWLEQAARAVSQPGGMFPVPYPQVIVAPSSPTRFPIHFGHTGRSGGASIVLFMPTDLERDELRADWIAIHEFSHLWHPFIDRGDAWLSEGLATYLQEVLRVRAGLLPAAEAWQRLYEGARLGRGAEQSLEQETHRMGHAHNYQIVYWAGAAIALMGDVELRRASAGKLSLDRVLAGLSQRRASFVDPVSAAELLRVMDEIAGMPVFEVTAQHYLRGGPLPDLDELYRQLGLRDCDHQACAAVDAPLAWVRDAIMAQSTAAD
jgi:hypothetical protein